MTVSLLWVLVMESLLCVVVMVCLVVFCFVSVVCGSDRVWLCWVDHVTVQCMGDGTVTDNSVCGLWWCGFGDMRRKAYDRVIVLWSDACISDSFMGKVDKVYVCPCRTPPPAHHTSGKAPNYPSVA